MERIMNEVMALCSRYAEMYNAEQRVKNCVEDEKMVLSKGYLLNKELFDIQYKKVEQLITHKTTTEIKLLNKIMEKRIIEGNKLIAEFMGERKINLELDEGKSGYLYHSSWDWLMPVVKKCTEVDRFKFFAYLSVAIFAYNHIDIVWDAVVSFIKSKK